MMFKDNDRILLRNPYNNKLVPGYVVRPNVDGYMIRLYKPIKDHEIMTYREFNKRHKDRTYFFDISDFGLQVHCSEHFVLPYGNPRTVEVLYGKR
jgi:hypothetical protein